MQIIKLDEKKGECPSAINLDYINLIEKYNLRRYDHINNFNLLNSRFKNDLREEYGEEVEIIFSLENEELRFIDLIEYILRKNLYRKRDFIKRLPNLVYYRIIDSCKDIYLGAYENMMPDYKDRFSRNDYYTIKTRDDYFITKEALTILNIHKYHLKNVVGYNKTKNFIERELYKLRRYADRNNLLINENKYLLTNILARDYKSFYRLEAIDHKLLKLEGRDKKISFLSVYDFHIDLAGQKLNLYVLIKDMNPGQVKQEYLIVENGKLNRFLRLEEIDFTRFL